MELFPYPYKINQWRLQQKVNYHEIIDYIESWLIPDMDAKKVRNDVFIPFSLINESGKLMFFRKSHLYIINTIPKVV